MGVVLLEGSMHFLISCFPGIGFVYGDIGLKELLYEFGVFAKNTVNIFFPGKDFDRALRAVLLVNDVLNRRLFVNFHTWLSQHNEELSEELLVDISSCLDCLAKGDTDCVDEILDRIDAGMVPPIYQFRAEGREASSLLQFWGVT